MELLRYCNDPTLFRVNEMPDHAYFIPHDTEEGAGRARECSPFFYSLCGAWKFRYLPSALELDEFFTADYDDSAFEEITLPEIWQIHGKDRAQYQTSPYPFLFDPPNVPQKNPAASYRKSFAFSKKEGKRYELHLEGKDSCVYVWLNGAFVGYGEAPHCTSAFDITPYLQNGQNQLSLLVLKWCSGTYLDDQDKIRLSGIFRDVYILERAEAGLTDFTLTTDLDGNVSLSVDAKSPVTVSVYDKGQPIFSEVTEGGAIHFLIPDVRLWSAEDPYLYELRLAAAGEYISHRFGVRTTAVVNGVYLLNGKPIKLYGVNRHDSHPDLGYVTPVDFMREELCLMKKHNINAIRTSHYTNDPRFYQLCDELGFYLISEADMECHGCQYLGAWEEVVGNPAFRDAIVDRIMRMYATLKNFTSIAIWSLGNESGWGENLAVAAKRLRATGDPRPIHYEGCCHDLSGISDEELARLFSLVDFYSVMYQKLDEMKRVYDDPRFTLPHVLCEYSHAMGNSCGDLRFYDDIIQSDPRYAGGFIWEWCDHGIRKTDDNGVSYLAYGGDFGESHHCDNLCMDGTVTPDREPHSALAEAKAVFAPIRITRAADGTLRVVNRHFFTPLSVYDCRYTVTADRKVVAEGTLDLDTAPSQVTSIPLPLAEPYDAAQAHLTVTVTQKSDTAYAKRGHTVAVFSIPLQVLPAVPRAYASAPELTVSNTHYTVRANGTTYTFRRDEATLVGIEKNGKQLLAGPLTWQCFRAPTDNDYGKSAPGLAWQKERGEPFGRITHPSLSVPAFLAERLSDRVRIGGRFLFGVDGRRIIARGTLFFEIFADGRLTLTETGRFSEELNYWLPRYGFLLPLRKEFTEIRYDGMGPAECYEDKCAHAVYGTYTYTPDDPFGAYEKPQENGSHCGTTQVDLTCGDTTLSVSGGGFSFAASHFDALDMASKRHRKDLVRHDELLLSVDYRMSGVGSSSVGGQPPVPACRINAGEELAFSVELCAN